MQIAELWRYPVKSMGGEPLRTARLGPRGLHGDRLWAIRDVGRGETTTGRRIAAPLRCSARYLDEPPAGAGPGHAPEVVITFPDGTERSSGDADVHARLSELCGTAVELVALPAEGDRRLHRARLQTPGTLRRDLGIPDDERLPSATIVPLRQLLGLVRWTTPPGTFFDLFPLHVLTREALAALAAAAPDGTDFDVRRFRPNVVLEGAPPVAGAAGAAPGGSGARTGPTDGGRIAPEHTWAGGRLVGASGAVVRVGVPTVRCVVPTREQPELDRDPQVMRTVARETGRFLGAYAECDRAGELAVGDAVTYEPPVPPSRLRRTARRATERAVARAQRVVPGT